jgi:hypothetical protein
MNSPPVVWTIEPNNLCEVAQETARGRLDGEFFSRKGSLQLFADIEHCQQESGMIVYFQAMAREFKPVSFFVMIAVAAFAGRGATTTHRATAKEDVEK